jgi:DNA mismatch endonuclease (patch repair protein)
MSMVDRLTPQRRSWLMSRVKGKDTSPEIRVRRCAHALGLRFRIHRRDLPGKPDLVFTKRRLALFVHGCYWHRHKGCGKASAPASEFWAAKFDSNIERDARVTSELRSLGWRVAVIWECETRDMLRLNKILIKRVIERTERKAKNPRSRRQSKIR